jgi:cell division protein FtsN
MKHYFDCHDQRGGTALGFVMGLVLGLGIAVVVALYVTKSPAPLVDKQHKPTERAWTDPDRPNELPDPNKSLYGKTPAPNTVPNSPDTANSNSGEDALSNLVELVLGKKTDGATSKNDASRDVPQKATPNKATGQDDKAAAESRALAALQDRTFPNKDGSKPIDKDNAVEDKSLYWLQLGAFRSGDDAETLRSKLAMSGFEAKLSAVDANGTQLTRVRLGPWSRAEDLYKTRQRLAETGYDATVIKTK